MSAIRIANDVYIKEQLAQGEATQPGIPAIDTDVQYRRRPRESNNAESEDGIYNIRSRSTVPQLHKDAISRSQDDDPGLRGGTDFKQKQVFSGKVLAWLAYQSIGVIYGDIGTSPLYVYSGTFSSPPSREDLIGVLSLIIWSLIVMVTVKYVFIILRADNNGEGGTFSTYSLLSRYVSFSFLTMYLALNGPAEHHEPRSEGGVAHRDEALCIGRP